MRKFPESCLVAAAAAWATAIIPPGIAMTPSFARDLVASRDVLITLPFYWIFFSPAAATTPHPASKRQSTSSGSTIAQTLTKCNNADLESRGPPSPNPLADPPPVRGACFRFAVCEWPVFLEELWNLYILFLPPFWSRSRGRSLKSPETGEVVKVPIDPVNVGLSMTVQTYMWHNPNSVYESCFFFFLTNTCMFYVFQKYLRSGNGRSQLHGGEGEIIT